MGRSVVLLHIKNKLLGMTIAGLFLLVSVVYSTYIVAEESGLSIQNKSPRLVVLDSGLVEVLQALDLDNQLVLIPDDLSFDGQYPDAFRYKSSINIEGVLKLQPDAVLGANKTRDLVMMEQSKMAGLKTYHIDRTLPAAGKVRAVAQIFGVEEKGLSLVQQIEDSYQQARKVASSSDTSLGVVHISSQGAGGQATVAGRYTAAHQLIEAAGGNNLADLSVFYAYNAVTQEGLISLAPEAIIVSDKELKALGGEQGIWDKIPGLKATPAGMNQQLIVLPHNGLKNGSIASAETVLELARLLLERESS